MRRSTLVGLAWRDGNPNRLDLSEIPGLGDTYALAPELEII